MEFVDEKIIKEAVIKVIGLGGGGGNAVNHMYKNYRENAEYICANTDTQALNNIEVDRKIELGAIKATKGLGAGMKTSVGQEAAMENHAEIKSSIEGADVLFITVGMGGGTGTGSAPIVADIAKDLGILTVAVVTKPFKYEGKKKMRIAENGITKLINRVDSLIVLPNDRLVDTLTQEALMDIQVAFMASNEVLANSVNSITEITSNYGLMNIDFADIRTVMSMPGKAMIGSGIGSGENRALDATRKALSNPLIEEINLVDAKGILVNITGMVVGLTEITDISNMISEYAHNDADIKTGVVEDASMKDDIKVTLIATGLNIENNTFKLNDVDNQKSIIDDNINTSNDTTPQRVEPEIKMPDKNNKKFIGYDIPAYLRKRQKS